MSGAIMSGAMMSGAAAAAIAQAIKASGTIVSVEPVDFMAILGKMRNPLVVMAEGGILQKNFQYLTSYRGLAFFCKSDSPLLLPGDSELIPAKKIWIPG